MWRDLLNRACCTGKPRALANRATALSRDLVFPVLRKLCCEEIISLLMVRYCSRIASRAASAQVQPITNQAIGAAD